MFKDLLLLDIVVILVLSLTQVNTDNPIWLIPIFIWFFILLFHYICYKIFEE